MSYYTTFKDTFCSTGHNTDLIKRRIQLMPVIH